MENSTEFDLIFKTVESVDLYVTVFGIPSKNGCPEKRPTMLYFHSGGLTRGSRLGHLPVWLVNACLEQSWNFITADYRLFPTAPITELKKDFIDAFNFVVSAHFQGILGEKGLDFVDISKIIISGASAGVCAAAYLTNFLVSVDRIPRSFLGLYCEVDLGKCSFNSPKDEDLSYGPATKKTMEQLQYLFDKPRKPVVHGDIKWFTSPISVAVSPEDVEAYDQTNLTLNLFYNGALADAFTALPGVSSELRKAKLEDDDLKGQRRLIPKHLHGIFPLLNIKPGFPPTVLIHGEADNIISWKDSEVFSNEVKRVGTESTLIVAKSDRAVHGFDRGDVPEEFKALLKQGFEKLIVHTHD